MNGTVDYKVLHDGIISWIKGWFNANGNDETAAVIGISGGKDSTICAALLAEALGPKRVIGVMMPNGVQKDISDSEKVIETLGIVGVTINIGDTYYSLSKEVLENIITPGKSGTSPTFATNTPARLRMVTLYGVAAQIGNARVVNTCNLSESIVGWETYGGDGFGDFSPLGRLTVTEVVGLGDYMKLPHELVHKTPSDGMCGASDEDKFGFTYDFLDKVIRLEISSDEAAENRGLIDKMLSMNAKSHFKHENIRLPTYDPHFMIAPMFNW